ncbi:hypothetical protein M1105_03050 [Limibaculum sp. FT325]|uniref:hypothetical protein n=1 Tax=Thermohalobaculum sediminis TaxID=2939436 RepID=UPI0020BD792E|nr:hypothetical protein [Limibaculum sediminis]MCL5775979.1 hypothetical protein [Limibaculum sediminis]
MTGHRHPALRALRPARLACVAAALALGGCATLAPTLQTAAEGARVTAMTAAGGDDRTAAARIAQGIAAGQAAVTIGCAMIGDTAEVALFEGLRRYCAFRR